jgi:hypothetical protein
LAYQRNGLIFCLTFALIVSSPKLV